MRPLAIALLGLPLIAQTVPSLCDTPREIRAFLDQSADDANTPYLEKRIRLDSRISALLEKYPHDIALHQRRQSVLMGPMRRDWKTPIEEYRKLATAHPDNSLYQFLHARTIIGTQTREAIRLLEEVIRKEP